MPATDRLSQRSEPAARGPELPQVSSRYRGLAPDGGAGHGTNRANKSVGRALQALELVAASEIALGLSQLAKALAVPRSSLHSLLRALAIRRFLEVDGDGRYNLGVRSLEVGAAYLHGVSPLAAVHSELATLSRLLSMTAHYAILDAPDVVCLDKANPPSLGVQLASAVGARLPAHLTAVGKASLAYAGARPRVHELF